MTCYVSFSLSICSALALALDLILACPCPCPRISLCGWPAKSLSFGAYGPQSPGPGAAPCSHLLVHFFANFVPEGTTGSCPIPPPGVPSSSSPIPKLRLSLRVAPQARQDGVIWYYLYVS